MVNFEYINKQKKKERAFFALLVLFRATACLQLFMEFQSNSLNTEVWEENRLFLHPKLCLLRRTFFGILCLFKASQSFGNYNQNKKRKRGSSVASAEDCGLTLHAHVGLYNGISRIVLNLIILLEDLFLQVDFLPISHGANCILSNDTRSNGMEYMHRSTRKSVF